MNMPPVGPAQEPGPKKRNWARRHPVLTVFSGIGIAFVVLIAFGAALGGGGGDAGQTVAGSERSATPRPPGSAEESEPGVAQRKSEEPETQKSEESEEPEAQKPEEPEATREEAEEPEATEGPEQSEAPEEMLEEPEATEEAPDQSAAEVTFTVTGEAPDGVNITYGSDTDSRSGNSGTDEYGMPSADVPWEESLKVEGDALYYAVTAQLSGSGDINCKVVIDGETVAKGHASGDYNICSAQASQDFLGGWSG